MSYGLWTHAGAQSGREESNGVPLSIQMMAKEKVIFQKSKTVNPCATGTCAHTHACLICIVALLLITHAITNTT